MHRRLQLAAPDEWDEREVLAEHGLERVAQSWVPGPLRISGCGSQCVGTWDAAPGGDADSLTVIPLPSPTVDRAEVGAFQRKP